MQSAGTKPARAKSDPIYADFSCLNFQRVPAGWIETSACTLGLRFSLRPRVRVSWIRGGARAS